MSVKCLPDGELPEDEKRNLAVRGLLLAATEDKAEIISYCGSFDEGGIFFMWEIISNPVTLSVIVMCVLSLCKLNVILSLLVSAMVAGFAAGMGPG